MKMTESKWTTKKKVRWILCLVLFACVLSAGYIYLTREKAEIISSDLLPAVGDAKDRSLAEVAQEVADANYFTLTINPAARFPDGESEGMLQIINPETNVYPISVSVTLDETGEEVYYSGAIHPNQEILQVKLLKNLKQGVYPATATVTLYHPETNEKQGATKAAISITVDN
ncbi:hypothetical protein [Enterococcus termitis]|nr:hypothetical protein [Enterococcus termitis]